MFKTIVTNDCYEVPTKCVGRAETFFYDRGLIYIFYPVRLFLGSMYVTENLTLMYIRNKNYLKLF